MAFVLGKKSLLTLIGVHPALVQIVQRAIQITEQDFSVYEGTRTVARQKLLVAAGASHTMASMHIPGPDRLGSRQGQFAHAVDLVPWIDGEPRWEWGPCYKIAVAMDAAATDLRLDDKVCWGGIWDRYMSQYNGTAKQMEAEGLAYAGRRLKLGKKAFTDGPHFQVGRLG